MLVVTVVVVVCRGSDVMNKMVSALEFSSAHKVRFGRCTMLTSLRPLLILILILMSNKADVVLIHLYSLMTGLFTITVYITIIPPPMVPTIVVGM